MEFEAPCWILKLNSLLPPIGLPKEILAQMVEYSLRYWQLKVCVVVVGGLGSDALRGHNQVKLGYDNCVQPIRI